MKTVLALTFLAFIGCTSPKQTMNSNEALLTTNNWMLQTIYQDNDSLEVKQPVANIQFDTAKKTVNGKGGCNSYGAQYQLSNENISFTNSFATKMYCQEYQQIEDKYFAALAQVTRYEVSAQLLTFYHGDKLLLKFLKK